MPCLVLDIEEIAYCHSDVSIHEFLREDRVMNQLKSRHLFSVDIALHPIQELGATPAGERRVFPVSGGQFSGERLRGEISPHAGSDLLLIRGDSSAQQDVRMIL